MALPCCVWASVVALLRGSGHFAQYGVTLRTVIGTCLPGGILGGSWWQRPPSEPGRPAA